MRANIFLKAMVFCLSYLCSCKSFAQVNHSGSLGISRYSDTILTSDRYAASLSAATSTPDIAWSDAWGLGISGDYREIKPIQNSKDPEKQKDFFGSSDTSTTTKVQAYGVSLSKSFDRARNSIGVNYGESRSSQESLSYNSGLLLNRWLIQNRWRLGFTYRNSVQKQKSLDFTDTDGRRVVTPESRTGNSYGIDSQIHASERLILLPAYMWFQSKDRPAAWTISLEARQYLEWFNASIHASAQHYEDTSSKLSTNTIDGSLVSDSYMIAWHQKVWTSILIVPGYRFYREVENPRAEGSPYKQYGSDFASLSLRYRFSKSWTLPSNTLSFNFGKYLSNTDNHGTVAAVGFDWQG